MDVPFGERFRRFTKLFLDWFRTVPWLDTDGEVSLLEDVGSVHCLVILATRHMTPVYDRGKKKTKSWRSAYVMHDESIRADLVRSDLSSQFRIVFQFFKWLGSTLLYRGPLKKLGFHNPTVSFMKVLQLPNHDEVAKSLWDVPSRGAAPL